MSLFFLSGASICTRFAQIKILDNSFASFLFLLLLNVSTPCVAFCLPHLVAATYGRHLTSP